VIAEQNFGWARLWSVTHEAFKQLGDSRTRNRSRVCDNGWFDAAKSGRVPLIGPANSFGRCKKFRRGATDINPATAHQACMARPQHGHPSINSSKNPVGIASKQHSTVDDRCKQVRGGAGEHQPASIVIRAPEQDIEPG
jgi:hypothetical protein